MQPHLQCVFLMLVNLESDSDLYLSSENGIINF